MNFLKIIFRAVPYLPLFCAHLAYAQNNTDASASVGTVANIVGQVTVNHQGKNVSPRKGDSIFEGDDVITGKNGAIKINFKDGSNFMAFQETEFKILEYKVVQTKKGGVNLSSVIQTFKGDIRAYVKPKAEGTNDSKFVAANNVLSVRGTVLALKNNALVVETGTVDVASLTDPNRPFVVKSGQGLSLTTTSAEMKQVTPIAKAVLEIIEQNTTSLQQDKILSNQLRQEPTNSGLVGNNKEEVQPVQEKQNGIASSPIIAKTMVLTDGEVVPLDDGSHVEGNLSLGVSQFNDQLKNGSAQQGLSSQIEAAKRYLLNTKGIQVNINPSP